MATSTGKLWQYLRRQDPKPDSILILVHGAGPFTFDEWKPILQAIDTQAGQTNYDCIGFVYADALPPMAADDSAARNFRSRFAQEIARERLLSAYLITQSERRRHGEKLTEHATGLGSLFFDLFFALHLDNVIAWIAKYLLKLDVPVYEVINAVHAYLRNPSAAAEIQKQLGDALDEAMQYKTIVLVSHSLGTIVALDSLNNWKNHGGQVAYWFTLGSPLSKLRRLRDDGTPNKLVQSNVARWRNLYDDDDWIANVLGPEFSPQETNSAKSTQPYVHDIFVNVAHDMPQAHAYYFNPPTQKLIAEVLP